MKRRRRWIVTAWFATGAIVFVTIASDSAILHAFAGLLLVAWGLVMTTNYRGAADAFPTRFGIGPIWQETSRGMLRVSFGFFGLCGLLLLYSGVAKMV